MTNYESIISLSIDDMAALFYGIIHENNLATMKRLKNEGVDVHLVERAPELQIEIHKRWLESEVEYDR